MRALLLAMTCLLTALALSGCGASHTRRTITVAQTATTTVAPTTVTAPAQTSPAQAPTTTTTPPANVRRLVVGVGQERNGVFLT